MNPRIPVIGVVGAFAVVILIIAYSGTSVIDDTSGEARLGSSGGETESQSNEVRHGGGDCPQGNWINIACAAK